MRPGLGDQSESGVVTVTDAYRGRPLPLLPELRTPVVPVEAGVGPIPLFMDLTGQFVEELSVEKDEEEMMSTRSGSVHGESTETIRAYNINSDLVRALVGRMSRFYESNPVLTFEGSAVRVQDLPMALTDSGQQLTLQNGLTTGEWSWDAIENAYGAKALSEANLRRLASLKDAEGKTSGGVSALRESYYAPDRVFATLLVAMGRTPLEGNGFGGLTMNIEGQAVPCLVVGYSHCALYQGPGEGSFGAECALGYTSTSTTQLTAIWPVNLSMVKTGTFWAMGEGTPADMGATSPRSYATATAAAAAALADAAPDVEMPASKGGGRRKRKRTHRRRRTRRRGKKTRNRRKRRRKTKRRKKLRSKMK